MLSLLYSHKLQTGTVKNILTNMSFVEKFCHNVGESINVDDGLIRTKLKRRKTEFNQGCDTSGENLGVRSENPQLVIEEGRFRF